MMLLRLVLFGISAEKTCLEVKMMKETVQPSSGMDWKRIERGSRDQSEETLFVP